MASISGEELFTVGNASDWAEYLTKWGYMGVGLFLFLLAVAFFLSSRDRVVTYIVGCVGLLFLVMFGITNFWVTNQRYILTKQPPIVFIRVLNLPDPDEVALRAAGSDPPRPYNQRENHAELKGQFNQKFIVLHGPVFDCMTLVITHKNRDSAFDIQPIDSGDADGRTEIILTPRWSDNSSIVRLQRRRDNEPLGPAQDLHPLPVGPNGELAKGCGDYSSNDSLLSRKLLNIFIPPAQAAEPSLEAKIQSFSSLLQSSDVFTRRQARRDLANLGPEALPIIATLLQQDSYRVRIGALEALADLPDSVRRTIPDEIWAFREGFFSSPDDTMRQVAQRAFDLNNAPSAYCYQERDTRQPIDQRFLILCIWTREDCKQIRGNNPNTQQTACVNTAMRTATQKLMPGGTMGSWYVFGPSAFGPPFPQLSPVRFRKS